MTELRSGLRVRIKETMLYNGRVGVLHSNSGDPEDFWDFTVKLDAQPVPEGETHSFPEALHGARTIGVNSSQVELISEG